MPSERPAGRNASVTQFRSALVAEGIFVCCAPPRTPTVPDLADRATPLELP